MDNFGIDTLVSYMKEKISDTTLLINPEYRDIENQQKKLVSKLNVRKVKFATMLLAPDPIEKTKWKNFFVRKQISIAR